LYEYFADRNILCELKSIPEQSKSKLNLIRI